MSKMGQQESTDNHYVPLSSTETQKKNNEPFLDELKLVTKQALEAKAEARRRFIAERLTESPMTNQEITCLITNLKNTLLQQAKMGHKYYDCQYPLIPRMRHESQDHECLEEYKKWAIMILLKIIKEFCSQTKMIYCPLKLVDHDLKCDGNIHIDPDKFYIHITW